MGIAYYCPSCWSEVRTVTVCPVCGADLRRLANEDYEQKLIRALHHPEPTVPIRAATILGLLGSQAAVGPLIELALSSEDFYIQEGAVAALGRIGDRRAVSCLERLGRDGALRVREAARRAPQLLGDFKNAARP